jgi:hypothetical protein
MHLKETPTGNPTVAGTSPCKISIQKSPLITRPRNLGNRSFPESAPPVPRKKKSQEYILAKSYLACLVGGCRSNIDGVPELTYKGGFFCDAIIFPGNDKPAMISSPYGNGSWPVEHRFSNPCRGDGRPRPTGKVSGTHGAK